MSMAKFDTVETPENHEVKPPEVIEDTESIKSGDGESGIDSEIENFAKMGEDETSNETSNETKESPEDSEVKNSYAEGMSEADKEVYGISSEIEDFVRTGQMDDVKLPSEKQNEGVDLSENSNLDSEIEKTTDGTDENDNDKLTLMDKVKLASAAILTGLSIRADQEAYAQDISNLTRDNTIERVEEPPEDYSGMAENFRDAASEILKKSEDEEGEGEGLEGGKEISSDVGEDGKTMEMHTSFEQDGTTLQEAWNTDVDNVAYDQNDDE